MKTKLKIIIFLIFFSIPILAHSQPTPPSTHGNNVNTSPSGAAPVGSGTGLLLALGGVYTWFKVYKSRKGDN